MKKRKFCNVKVLKVLFFLLGLSLSCDAQDCKKLPKKFTSPYLAISLIKKCTFKIEETTNTSRSSWITSAKYYSCDGNTGYFIIRTIKDQEYIHQEMPLIVWVGFKNASSKGTYYNVNIKNRYQLKVN